MDSPSKTLLIITDSLSSADGKGRFSQGLIKEFKRFYELIALAALAEKTEGIKIIKIPDLFHSRNILDVIKYSFLNLKYSKRANFIHFFTDIPYYLIFSPVIWFKIKPYFITVHGTYGIAPLNSKWKKFLLRKIYQRAEKVICISNFTQRQLLKRIALNNTTTIHNGVDFERFARQKFIKKEKTKNIILSVGVVKVRKGYHISIPAVIEAKKFFPNLKYYIIGKISDKVYFNKLKKIIKNSHLEDDIVFLGEVPGDKLIDFYYQADLFLLTPVINRDSFEGFGLVYLEANTCGKPVIGTYDCGAEEAIKDGYTGLLVPQNDILKTSEAIVKLLSNPTLVQNLGENGRKRAKDMEWQRAAGQYLKIYNHLF